MKAYRKDDRLVIEISGEATTSSDLLGIIYHKQCHDCGQFLPRDRWVRTDDPYKAHGLCRDCGIMYDDPAFM